MATCILQAKYYPHKAILATSIGKRHSYAWRSIMSALPTLQKGLEWRVGNGKDIRIWGDPWLPTPTSFSVHSSRRFMPANTKVAALIDPDLKC
jgi:hypothetical protein